MSVPANRFRPRPQYTHIEGLSSVRRLPRIGKVRLGIKAKSAKGVEYPKDVDYFVCPPEVQKVYGEKPTEIDVLIPCEDQALFFPQSLKCYRGSRLWCKGDGRTATRIDMDTGAMSERECPCEHYGDDCGERASLMVLLPNVSMSGIYQIDTGSTGNIIELNSTVEWLRGMIGRIAFVPLTLKRVPTQLQAVEKDGKVRTVTKALLKLEFKGDIKAIASFRERDIISIEGGGSPLRAMLPPAPVEDGEDHSPGAVVVEEHDPETGEVPMDDPPPADPEPDAGTGKPEPAAPVPITEGMRKRLYAVAKENSISTEWMKHNIKEEFGKESSKDLTMEEAGKLIEMMLSPGPV